MEDKTFFTILIESRGSEESFIQAFWSWADHLGGAIDRVLRACARMGIHNAMAGEADTYDFAALPRRVTHDKKLGVFFDETRHCFTTEESFAAPVGIIKSCLDGEYGEEMIREGFSLSNRDDGIYEVEAVVGREKLFDTFIRLGRRLPSIKVFWVKLSADWEEDGREEFWVNEGLNTPALVSGYLTSHANDTINNGHVSLTAYSGAGQTNLLIDSHKTVKVLTKSARMQSRMAAALKRLGFKELAELYSLEYDYYHWHYRPARSKSRARLVASLKKEGFSTWNPSR